METPFCPSWFYRVFLHVEEYIGIEPTPPAWKAGILTAIRILHGAPDRNRTCNLLITKQLLCLLSYRSMMAARILPLLWKGIGEAFYKRLGDLYGNRTSIILQISFNAIRTNDNFITGMDFIKGYFYICVVQSVVLFI